MPNYTIELKNINKIVANTAEEAKEEYMATIKYDTPENIITFIEDNLTITDKEDLTTEFEQPKTTRFTPIHIDTDERMEMIITQEDYNRHNEQAAGDNIIITDLNTDKQYISKKLDCGLDCNCDAMVSPIF